jgi:RNA polymerase sigma factor for flagellar operon FliA
MEAENQKKSRCTVESDLELLRRYQNDDLQALAALFEVHYGLIKFWARKLSEKITWVDRDDLTQLVCIGFIEAAQKFQASRTPYFHAWATKYVRWSVFKSPDVNVMKRTLHDNYREVIKAQYKLMEELNRRPTTAEISKETKLSEMQIDNALKGIAAFPLALEEEDANVEIADPYQQQLIKEVSKQLSSYQAQIIKRYYVYGQTDPEIAEDLDKSEEAIKEARQRALKKLRKIIGEDGRDGTQEY